MSVNSKVRVHVHVYVYVLCGYAEASRSVSPTAFDLRTKPVAGAYNGNGTSVYNTVEPAAILRDGAASCPTSSEL